MGLAVPRHEYKQSIPDSLPFCCVWGSLQHINFDHQRRAFRQEHIRAEPHIRIGREFIDEVHAIDRDRNQVKVFAVVVETFFRCSAHILVTAVAANSIQVLNNLPVPNVLPTPSAVLLAKLLILSEKVIALNVRGIWGIQRLFIDYRLHRGRCDLEGVSVERLVQCVYTQTDPSVFLVTESQFFL
jgi:hypothetical protein